MREHLTPTPRTPREIALQHALILRRLSAQMRRVLLSPDAIASPESLRRTLAGSARMFEEYADDLEDLAVSASHTLVRVPTWRDGLQVALGLLVPCAAFLGLIAFAVSGAPNAPTDPEQIQRSLSDEKWIQEHEDRLEAISRGGHGDR